MHAATPLTNEWQAIIAIITLAVAARVVTIGISAQIHDRIARIAPLGDEVKERLLGALFAAHGFLFKPQCRAMCVILTATKRCIEL